VTDIPLVSVSCTPSSMQEIMGIRVPTATCKVLSFTQRSRI
jgi:hypothetical protein